METRSKVMKNYYQKMNQAKEDKLERIQQIPISQLHPFKDHPFKIVDDESMLRTVESVSQFGVIVPAIARPRPEGGYELISGHRRKHASELAGKTTMPVIVRNMDDDAAVILMVDSNLQREKLLPSEKAWAYRMKLEALKHQGERGDLTSAQVGQKSWAVNQVAGEAEISKTQVQRFIRLTYLLPELLDKVDSKELAFNPAVEISFLSDQEQFDFIDAMDETQNAPSLSQAQQLKKLSQEGACTAEAILAVMNEEKKEPMDRVTLKGNVLRKYFPKNYTPEQMENIIVKLLEQWQLRKERQKNEASL